MPGTPRVPIAGQHREAYWRYITAGYSHAQAEWLADCDATRTP